LVCLQSFTAFSQYNKSSSLWYNEHGRIIDFKTKPPSISEDKNLQGISYGRSSAVADGNGNLLFYTSGDTIWNRFDAPMPGGKV
jgi:hypothetical protein